MKTAYREKVEAAINDLHNGKMIILVDKEDRENEGDLIFPAEMVTDEKMSFLIRHCSGIICLALSPDYADKLQLPLMVPPKENSSCYGTAFTVSIEAKEGVSTGVSAADRTRTILVAMDDNAEADDLARPGHIFPLRANKNGVLGREGHTEGSVDLVKLAGFKSGAVLCEVTNPDGTMTKGDALGDFAKEHDITILSIEDIIAYRRSIHVAKRKTETTITLENHGTFTLTLFENGAMALHKPSNGTPLVRIHSACFTGDVLGSLHCDCRKQLDYALSAISQDGGMVIYLDQEGRGIGLENKIKAYALQREGMDTVEANIALGFPADGREYHDAVAILNYYKFDKIKLLTNNPAKVDALKHIEVEMREMPVYCNSHNEKYLKTKSDKLHHKIEVAV